MRTDRMRLEVNPMCEVARSSAGRSRLDSSQPVAVDVPRDEVDGEDTDIGDVIRANFLKLRQERGLSLRQLAELAGTSQSTLEDLASGKRFPGIELLWKLAQALDVPCTAFIEESAMAALPSAPSAIRTTSA
jgi:ribosome-binding protein aMBF1 (putative translation factor)